MTPTIVTDIIVYLKARIFESDDKLELWCADVFNNNDMNTARANKFYNLAVADTKPTRDGNGLAFLFPVKIVISEEVGTDFLEGFSRVYDKGLAVGLNIVDPKNIELSDFTDIEIINIEPTEEKNNDSIISCTIQLNIKCDWSFL